MSFVFFDLKQYFDSRGVYYREEGKNVSRNWLGIDCIYCGGEGQHLGVHKEHKTFSCFQCGRTTNLWGFIRDFENCSNSDVAQIIKEFSNYSQEMEIIERKKSDDVIFPSNIEWSISGIAKKFLENRGFDPVKIQNEYGVGMTRKLSVLEERERKLSYDNRLIIPFLYDRKLVSYTGRDYFDTKDPKYLNPFLEAVRVPTASAVYNTHSVKKKCIIVEGVTDVWRMGEGCISLQGITFTKYQLWVLSKLDLDRVVILFDKGASENARKLANRLSLFIPDVQYTVLKEGDPAELEDSEARHIKYDLIGV